ncbi:uncharacterized protein LOC141900705 [Tubulanus polymorphus]|uniref:uncharacterized protein LOC141900705 n=1 Tax=Tubulanus polymorphus TaxID=672921 RepID=UPI003DA684A0
MCGNTFGGARTFSVFLVPSVCYQRGLHERKPCLNNRFNNEIYLPSSLIYSNRSDDGRSGFTKRKHEELKPEKSYVSLFVIGWFIAGLTLSNLNKYIFQQHNFNYPIRLSVAQVFMCYLVTKIILERTSFREHHSKLEWKCWKKLSILSVIFCASVAIGNMGISFGSVSFSKMILSITPVITAILSRIITKTKKTSITYLSMVPVCLGTLMCVLGETDFVWSALVANLLSATLKSGKTISQGLLLKDENMNSLSLLYYISIPCVPMLIVVAFVTNQTPDATSTELSSFATINVLFLLVLDGLVCAIYNVLTFLVTYHTHDLTVALLGNVMTVFNILLSVVIFGTGLSVTSVCGMIVTLSGIWMYNNCDRTRKRVASVTSPY